MEHRRTRAAVIASGASGSSTTSANDRVPSGAFVQRKRRRDLLTLAAVAAGDRLCIVEGAALETECVHQQVRWSAAAVRHGSSAP
jgi:hypothetical protein